MTVQVVHGNALDLAGCGIADDSVDLIVTSPPYFGLRSYQDDGEHYAGQIGAEATPAEFVDALVAATAEMVRVLKPSGSIFVNLGDSAVNKCYQDLPHRYSIAVVDRLRLWKRAEIVWNKPNGMPESVTDRVRRSHEVWFHFTKRARYYANVDEVREPHTGRLTPNVQPLSERTGPTQVPGNTPRKTPGPDGMGSNPLGKLPGSVWSIPTRPLRLPPELGVQHFAAFPMEWPRKFIQGWCPPGICTECGEGRRSVAVQTNAAYAAERARIREDRATTRTDREVVLKSATSRTNAGGYTDISNGVVKPEYAITGEACACFEPSAPTTPAVVLDPFGGTGTTATVAHALGRHGITVDLSRDYCRVAEWRTADPGQLAKARQEPKPKATVTVPTEQGDVELQEYRALLAGVPVDRAVVVDADDLRALIECRNTLLADLDGLPYATDRRCDEPACDGAAINTAARLAERDARDGALTDHERKLNAAVLAGSPPDERTRAQMPITGDARDGA